MHTYICMFEHVVHVWQVCFLSALGRLSWKEWSKLHLQHLTASSQGKKSTKITIKTRTTTVSKHYYPHKPWPAAMAASSQSSQQRQQQSNSVQVGRAGAISLFRFAHFWFCFSLCCFFSTVIFCRLAFCELNSDFDLVDCRLPFAVWRCLLHIGKRLWRPLLDARFVCIRFRLKCTRHSPWDPHDRLHAFLPSNFDALKSIRRIHNVHSSSGWF